MSAPFLDPQQVELPVHRTDPAAFLSLLRTHRVGDLIQLVGARLPGVLDVDRTAAEPVVQEVIAAARARDAEGDAELAEDLETLVSGAPPAGEPLPVDLEDVVEWLEAVQQPEDLVLVDRRTGEVALALTDMDLGTDDDDPLDPSDPRWLVVTAEDSREGWRDMHDFVLERTEGELQERLLEDIDGRGAFRRFRDRVHRAEIHRSWYAFQRERRLGRVRRQLALAGFRPVLRPPR